MARALEIETVAVEGELLETVIVAMQGTETKIQTKLLKQFLVSRAPESPG